MATKNMTVCDRCGKDVPAGATTLNVVTGTLRAPDGTGRFDLCPGCTEAVGNLLAPKDAGSAGGNPNG